MVFRRIIFFISVICFFGATVFAQSKMPSRWSIGAVGSADICYRTLSIQNETSTAQETVRMRECIETPKLGFTVGLEMNRMINSHMALGMRVQYTNRGYQTVMDNLTYGNMTDPRTGFIYDTAVEVPTAITIVDHFHSLDLPIKAQYFFGHKKMKGIVGIGCAMSVLIRTNSTVIKTMKDGSVQRDKSEGTGDFNSLNVFPMVSAGVDWTVNDKSSIRFEPIARYGALKIIDAPITEHLWSYGLQIGYYFSL